MIPKHKQAAHLLEGRILDGGWLVGKKIEKSNKGSVGIYSCYYEVSQGDRKGFLKAFDYSNAAKITDNFAAEIHNITATFNLEKEILEICRDNGCKNVIEILDTGATNIPEATEYPRVEYLILELAEGNINEALEDPKISLEWKIRSLHQLAKGLSELHKLSIAHQDIKPANIVKLPSGLTKVSDLGSAASVKKKETELPFIQRNRYAGTWSYAPPELLYGYVSNDNIVRRIGCDLYLLGSMISFYFTNMNMTSLIRNNLSDSLCWTDPRNIGKYEEYKAYLIQAFEIALQDVESQIEHDFIKENVIESIRYLCNPDPMLRGHKKNIAEIGSNYSLERFVTLFDLMARKLKIKQI